MTKEELEARVAEDQLVIQQASDRIAESNKQLAMFKATDRESANKQLSLIRDSMNELWNQAEKIVNEFQLEFSFESDYGDFVEMDIYRHGMWAYSSC